MKKLLFITKNFSPEIYGGIRRIQAVYNLLSNHSKISLDVITAVDTDKYKNVKFVRQLFFNDKKVETNGISFSKNISKIKLIDKAFIGWLPNVLKSVLFKKYDYVYASCPSFTNIIIAYLYKIFRFNKPSLIIEYRDFFSLNPVFKETLKKKFIRFFEKRIIKKASYIIVTTGAMRDILKSHKDESKIYLVRNYIDKKTINEIGSIEKVKFNDDLFHIGHIGKLNVGRDPSKALKLLSTKIYRKDIGLHFIGINEDEKSQILYLAAKNGYDTERLFFEGVVDRTTSLKYMRSFDGVLLIINNEVQIKNGFGVPGKIYDYIFMNNNIFSDIETFNNIKDEFDFVLKEKLNGITNFMSESKSSLDNTFNDVISEIIN